MDFDDLTDRQLLELIFRELYKIREEQSNMSKELDDLTAEVAAEETVEQSAITLIDGLAAQITSAGTDPAKLSALTTSIKTQSDALAAAVTANTH